MLPLGLHLASHAGKLRDSFQGTLGSVLVAREPLVAAGVQSWRRHRLWSLTDPAFEYAMEGIFATTMSIE